MSRSVSERNINKNLYQQLKNATFGYIKNCISIQSDESYQKMEQETFAKNETKPLFCGDNTNSLLNLKKNIISDKIIELI